MELDFDKYCIVERSPTTVLPSPKRRTKSSSRDSNGKTKYGNIILNLNEDFTEISFNQEDNEVLERGSVYQSSKEVRLLKNTDAVVGRKKIELSLESSSTLSFGLINSLCSSDEDESLVDQTRSSSVTSLSEQMSRFLVPPNICSSDNIRNQSSYYQPVQDSMIVPRVNDGNSPRERDMDVNLHKSLSANLVLPRSPAQSESDSSHPKARFSPTRKLYDPFVKSKYQRSPPSFAKETGRENKTIFKSRLNDLSDKPRHLEYNLTRRSSVHLHAILKLENKDGVPCFEFSVKSPEDVYISKRCKFENALTWVYTFHSINRRKSNASGWGFKGGNGESTVLGQMHISCYHCTESKGGVGAFEDSMVTEFVLYDTSHSRTSTAELGPELEIAAIVMQVPSEKRESLKYKSGDSKMDKPFPNLLDIFRVEKGENVISKRSSPGKMHIVIPAGNHSLPSNESGCPSSLLDRWRLGGGCDCGGWDMACPINVFDNPNIQIPQLMDNRHPVELFVQGRKDDLPAFSMRIMEDGKYEVDFHAKLSSLQAFSICVAILHAAESSSAVGQERSKRKPQSDTMKVFAEEEIKYMIGSIAEEEKFKVSNKMEDALQSFVVNPPFSPIARV
ncbi:hypothetical protein ACJIZ3_008225 [Penstemon smallii]|uniref:Uncharacterized protein n=1 Tax=Penstemon smallii TaxID=265156 RepID=A0ABD3T980_9LAMI